MSAVACRQLRDRLTPADPVPLARAYVDAHVPKHAAKGLLARLVAAGVLATDGRYARPRGGSPGLAREYALGPAFHAAPLRASPVDHPELRRKAVRARDAAEAGAVATDPPTMTALREHLNAAEVAGGPLGSDPALDALRSGDPWFARDDYGRLHTPATSLARVNRRHVRLAGEHPVSVDVSQSQPWLVARHAAGNSPGKKQGRGRKEGSPEQERTATHPYPLAAHCPHVGANDDFTADVDAGVLYDRLAEWTLLSRDAAKKGFLVVIYGGERYALTPIGRAFARLYPATFAVVAAWGREHDPAELARELQRRESAVMLDGAAARLVRDRPDLPFLTVHDAVLCRPGDAAFVAEVARSAWLDRYGAAPKLKTASWAKE